MRESYTHENKNRETRIRCICDVVYFDEGKYISRENKASKERKY